MREIALDTVIAASPEAIFDLVADLSKRPAWCDHYLEDYRLARANPVGEGAAARFLLDAPMFSERGELVLAECDRPRRIVEQGRLGRLGRSRMVAVYEFVAQDDGGTKVELKIRTEPKTALDRFRLRRAQGWLRRKSQKALERLRQIFEDSRGEELASASVAGYEGAKAPRFGARVSVPERAPATDG